jgi:hypothetical protein
MDGHGRVFLSGWVIGGLLVMTGGMTGDGRQRFIHQRVFATAFKPAHLTQDGRGMQPLTSCQSPERRAVLDVVKIMAHGSRKPVWQAGSRKFWQFSRPVLVATRGEMSPALDYRNLGWN